MLTSEQKILFKRLSDSRKQDANTLEKPNMRGIKRSVVDKYSDHAHFIYELLQNADDAKATKVRFVLNETGLIFAHNGTIHFSLTDSDKENEDTQKKQLGHINSITSIGNSTKSEAQIGKFGVGFKAVFQYTDTPEIYDTPFAFKIERFIVPVLLEKDHPDRKPEETLFYFPFNNPDKASQEVSEKLDNLINPLLFLRYLEKITWSASNGKQGKYTKEVDKVKLKNLPDQIKFVEQIRLKHKHSTNPLTIQDFLVFTSSTNDVESSSHSHLFSIAYLIERQSRQVSYKQEFPAYCFFPTKESTKLRFIVQAPFLLTDSRAEIKEKEQWNEYLIKCLAKLTTDSLPVCKERGLLTEDFFNVLPIKSSDFFTGYLFK